MILRKNPVQRHRAIEAIDAQLRNLSAEREWEVSVKEYEEPRTLDQNDKMWAMLGDVAEQVEWYGTRLKDYEWKDVFTAALKRHKVVPGLDGGFVVVGARTSRMSKKTMSELIELMYAFGAERGVVWTDPNEKAA